MCFDGELFNDNGSNVPVEAKTSEGIDVFNNEPPPGVHVDGESAGQNLTQWIVHMEGAKGTLYEGEQFQLQFKFSSKYPFDSPEVTFIGGNIPIHPHVYSNGHICLSILTEDWSPALSVQSICLSIVSMLSSCKEKKRPPDNTFYVKTCNKNPKKQNGGIMMTVSNIKDHQKPDQLVNLEKLLDQVE